MSILTGRAPRRSLRAALLVIPTVAVVLFSAGPASANVPLTQVSTDPYTDPVDHRRTAGKLQMAARRRRSVYICSFRNYSHAWAPGAAPTI